MKRSTLAGIVIGLIVLVLIGSASVFTVHQAEQALVLQFGQPKRAISDAGLHFKMPFLENVIYFDKRVLNLDLPSMEVPTNDQKQVVIETYAKYKIMNPLKFYQVVRDEAGLRGRVGPIINSNLRAELGKVSMAQMLTAERATFMRSIAVAVGAAAEDYGVEVIDVRMKRVDLPQTNSEAIFKRMQTQREQEARRFRAEGQRDAQTRTAEADKQRVVIMAEARKQAEILRGEGDAEATRIYAEAYGRDAAFFDFFRSLQALDNGLSGSSTTFVGPPTGDFFRYFGRESGTAAPQP
jgi:membrane protease subunit HflC